ncbi:MAG: sugar ABC transporter permease [Rhodospirillaceae bacterium]|nr:sugar ABC transporter permease [Rhodospirillaceae bacterium]
MTPFRDAAAPRRTSPRPRAGSSGSPGPGAEATHRASPVPAAGARGRPSLERQRVRTGLVFLAPALLAAAAVAGWPLLRTILIGFTDAQLSSIGEARWIGFANFEWVLTDPDWWRAVWNTLGFAAVSVALELVLGLACALLLNAPLRWRKVLWAVALVPWAVPTVVSAQLWRLMFNDSFGVVNDLLARLGIIDAPVAWLADPLTAMAAVVLTDVWKTTPFATLLLLAGLQMIPDSLYDAARMDGAGSWQRFRYVTLPMLRTPIGVAVVFRALDALRVFDLIYVMTSNSRSTASVSVYARQQLVDFQDAGLGSAASTLIFVVIAVISTLFVTTLRPFAAPGR